MKTKTLDVATCDNWELVCATNHDENDLPPALQNVILRACWEIQDGYGKVGFTPPQGWDWSGIRDSTDHAKGEMAKAIRKVLGKHRITTITVTYEDNVRF